MASRILGNICQYGLDDLPLGQLPKKLKGTLDTALEISNGMGGGTAAGSVYADVPSVPGTELSCKEGGGGWGMADASVCAWAL